MAFAAGRLRQIVRIEHLVSPVDSNGDPLRGDQGELVDQEWQTFEDNVRAAIEPLNAREFIQSAAMQSQITGKIFMRYRALPTASMRLVHVVNGVDGKIYNPAGFVQDKETGLEYLMSPVSEGVNDGQ